MTFKYCPSNSFFPHRLKCTLKATAKIFTCFKEVLLHPHEHVVRDIKRVEVVDDATADDTVVDVDQVVVTQIEMFEMRIVREH